MAVNIEELHIETQPSTAQPGSQAASAAAPAPPKADVRAELEKIRERYLRLQAD
jgi:hypothetical protein